ncbi:MAG: hypothetical protein EZS28_007485 [Streblomastix strix]|uniref:C2 domain-containing protein n=1 Tax=Streblomastix strix TaxID=222440 RepID=A0A5J4WR03_9EUKA|nr:MAG: hypothetical protein EZS28_007485 [Streblomastix strix]
MASTDQEQDTAQADAGSAKHSVIVKVIGVKNVAAMDSNGKSDPFVVLKFAGQEQKTKKIADTLNAEFNETFTFEFDPVTVSEREISLELWDYDTIGDNDQIGQTKLPIGEADGGNKACTLSFAGVNKQYGQNVGDLDVEVEYKKPQEVQKKERKKKEIEKKEEAPKETEQKVEEEAKPDAKKKKEAPSPARNTGSQSKASKRPKNEDRDKLNESKRSNQSKKSQQDGNLNNTLDGQENYHKQVVDLYYRSPGPIYNVQEGTKNVKPKIIESSFPKDDRAKHFTFNTIAPGPIYEVDQQFSNTLTAPPRQKLSKSERNTGMINTTNYKGTFHDTVDPNVNSKVHKLPDQKFSHDDRSKHFLVSTISKGPGAYDPPPTVGVKKSPLRGQNLSKQPRDTTEWCFMPPHKF